MPQSETTGREIELRRDAKIIVDAAETEWLWAWTAGLIESCRSVGRAIPDLLDALADANRRADAAERDISNCQCGQFAAERDAAVALVAAFEKDHPESAAFYRRCLAAGANVGGTT